MVRGVTGVGSNMAGPKTVEAEVTAYEIEEKCAALRLAGMLNHERRAFEGTWDGADVLPGVNVWSRDQISAGC
jgi:hypothetical protein